jgi:hypothetical protein
MDVSTMQRIGLQREVICNWKTQGDSTTPAMDDSTQLILQHFWK